MRATTYLAVSEAQANRAFAFAETLYRMAHGMRTVNYRKPRAILEDCYQAAARAHLAGSRALSLFADDPYLANRARRAIDKANKAGYAASYDIDLAEEAWDASPFEQTLHGEPHR